MSGGSTGQFRRQHEYGLSLVTLPEASEQADELFVRLNRWSEEYKPDWFRRLHGSPPGGSSSRGLVDDIGFHDRRENRLHLDEEHLEG